MADNGNTYSYTVEDGIALIKMDLPGEKVNKFSRSVMTELNSIIDKFAADSSAKGAIFYSAKPGIFIAGADIDELSQLKEPNFEVAKDILATGQKVFQKLNDLDKPVVALVQGAAMGGGVEFALACHARIAVDDGKTKLGLPETKLGILPGWGGTSRLPKMMGIYNSIDYICSAKNFDAKTAFDHGMVDFFCGADIALDEAKKMVKDMLEHDWWKTRRDDWKKGFELPGDEKMFTFGTMRPFILGMTGGNYPAVMAVIDSIEKGYNKPIEEALDIESTICAKLMGTPVSRALIGIFYMDQNAKQDKGVDSAAKPKDIKVTGTLGAGIMGGGIATALANVGFPVIMKDIADAQLKLGYDQAYSVLGSRVKKKKMTDEEMVKIITNIKGTLLDEDLKEVDVLIEAIVENMDLKKKVFGGIHANLKPDCIVASNTSTLSITEMASAYKYPEKFIGMHFFNPVHRMPLVEVIRGEKTDDETTATIYALAKKMGKTPIVCKDGPGFIVNRLLMPYMNEALLLVQEGYQIEDIDKIAKKFGMPMGPVMLSDMVGNDTAAHAGETMAKAFPDRVVPNDILEMVYKDGRYGNKNERGFYLFKKGKATKPDPEVYNLIKPVRKAEGLKANNEEILDRLFLPMLGEATRILEEGLVRKTSDIDLGMIFGTGFPPFRGGLLRWADTEGVAKLVEKMKKYESLGKRFEPTQLLKDMAAGNKKFYQD